LLDPIASLVQDAADAAESDQIDDDQEENEGCGLGDDPEQVDLELRLFALLGQNLQGDLKQVTGYGKDGHGDE
jgi:hypothetical protein